MKIIIHKKYLDIVSEKFPDIEFYTEIDECPEAEALIGEPMDFVPEKLDKMPNIRSVSYTHLDVYKRQY